MKKTFFLASLLFSLTSSIHAECLSIFTLMRFDKNLSRSFSFEEYNNFIDWRFAQFDKDKDGIITKNEMPEGKVHAFFQPMIKEGITLKKIDKIRRPFFNEIDLNKDGQIDLGEYKKFCEQGYAF